MYTGMLCSYYCTKKHPHFPPKAMSNGGFKILTTHPTDMIKLNSNDTELLHVPLQYTQRIIRCFAFIHLYVYYMI
jgi:hypothetical protein